MDPVEQIRYSVQKRVDSLGAEIIRFAELKQSITVSPGLSEAERAERTGEAEEFLRQRMETVFGEGSDSISSDIQLILDTSDKQAGDMERGRAAAGIWRQELPGLRRFLEYCTGIIESHPLKISPEVRKSQKCLTEASCVLEKISVRVGIAVGEE